MGDRRDLVLIRHFVAAFAATGPVLTPSLSERFV
jgi:hypothetical protein